MNDQTRNDSRHPKKRDERGAAPSSRPAKGGKPPARQQRQAQPLQEQTERARRGKRKREPLVAQKPIVNNQFRKAIEGVSGRETRSSPEGPYSNHATTNQSHPEPSADVST